MSDYSSWEILEMVNSRNPGCFNVVHGIYFRRMLVACLKRDVPRLEAEDIVTEIFVYIYTKGKDKIFRDPKEVSNYLFKSVYNRCNSWSRSRKIHARFLNESYHEKNSMMDLIELNVRERIWAAISNKVHDVLGKSDYRALAVVRMLYLEERSVREVASEMDISEQTVRNLKGLGLKIIRKSVAIQDIPIEFLFSFLLAYLIGA